MCIRDSAYDDQYEGDYDTRRTLIYTLQFIAKTYLYGPVLDKSGEVIKKSIVDYSTDSARTAPREVRYTATPRSLVDRTGDAVTTLSNSIDLNDGIFEVASVADLVVGDEFQVDTEVMHITRIVGTTLHVSRGYNQSTIATHTGGAGLLKIDSADNALVELSLIHISEPTRPY